MILGDFKRLDTISFAGHFVPHIKLLIELRSSILCISAGQRLYLKFCCASQVMIYSELYSSEGHPRNLGARMETVEVSRVPHLEVILIELRRYEKSHFQVARHAFKDVEVTGRFYLGEVSMTNVVSMAFALAYVKVYINDPHP